MERFESGADRDNEEFADRLREAADEIEDVGLQKFVELEDVDAEDYTSYSIFFKYTPTLE